MFYDYAYAKDDDLRRELFNESVEIVSGSVSDYMSMSIILIIAHVYYNTCIIRVNK